jgi:hypothetical protein
VELAGLEPGDLLGAISALSGPGFGLVEPFLHFYRGSPNTFPNRLRRVLQYDNGCEDY